MPLPHARKRPPDRAAALLYATQLQYTQRLRVIAVAIAIAVKIVGVVIVVVVIVLVRGLLEHALARAGIAVAAAAGRADVVDSGIMRERAAGLIAPRLAAARPA